MDLFILLFSIFYREKWILADKCIFLNFTHIILTFNLFCFVRYSNHGLNFLKFSYFLEVAALSSACRVLSLLLVYALTRCTNYKLDYLRIICFITYTVHWLPSNNLLLIRRLLLRNCKGNWRRRVCPKRGWGTIKLWLERRYVKLDEESLIELFDWRFTWNSFYYGLFAGCFLYIASSFRGFL